MGKEGCKEKFCYKMQLDVRVRDILQVGRGEKRVLDTEAT